MEVICDNDYKGGHDLHGRLINNSKRGAIIAAKKVLNITAGIDIGVGTPKGFNPKVKIIEKSNNISNNNETNFSFHNRSNVNTYFFNSNDNSKSVSPEDGMKLLQLIQGKNHNNSTTTTTTSKSQYWESLSKSG